jgi:serine protease Do
MTRPVADSLGLTELTGAIFDRPEPGSPAAGAGIEAGDVITGINGAPLTNAADFATTISMIAPGTIVHFSTWRNGQLIEVKMTLGSSKCPRRS